MRRKIYQQLLDWKKNRNGEVALLVEGARRIGKSYIVEEFGKNEYESYILIDFNKAPQMVRDWFDLYLEDLDTLFLYLSQHYMQNCVRRGARPYYVARILRDFRFNQNNVHNIFSLKKFVDNSH